MGDRHERRATPDARTTGDAARQVRLVHTVLDTLDTLLDAPIQERLAVVAVHAATCVSAAAWRVSRVDEETVRSQRPEIIRPPKVGDGPTAPQGWAANYPLVTRPALAEAAEGSAFSVTLDTADPVEESALAGTGFTSAVVAGGYDPDAHRWLLEIFGDESTHETPAFAAVLLALVQAALGFPRAAAPSRAAS
ncbi:hypothetical protein V6K52_19530 [Knoellia sp. S7-12]|uniref:hypothetical protein n=1 Tax=Knoellia sp. S7-12 TaxID=3126698 RepID=UPI003367CE0C